MVKTMRLSLVLELISLMLKLHFVSNKVIEIQAGDEKTRTNSWNNRHQHWCCFKRIANQDWLLAKCFDSTGIQNLEQYQEKLGILSGGSIGLEFAGLYNKLGSKVTVLDAMDTFLPRWTFHRCSCLNNTWKKTVLNCFKISILLKSKRRWQVLVVTENGNIPFRRLLYATGRKPNVEPLNENTDIELTERGAIKDRQTLSNKRSRCLCSWGCQRWTSIHLHFTWWLPCCLQLPCWWWQLHAKTASMYQTPCLSHLPFHKLVLTESQAADLKLPYAVKEIPVAAMPRGHVNGDLRGPSKLLSILKTKEILGATIFSWRISRNHQHHHCCYGQQDSLHLLHKTNLHSPNLGWKLEWLVCDLS